MTQPQQHIRQFSLRLGPKGLQALCCVALLLALASCSSKKYLAPGEQVLTRVDIEADDPQFKTSTYRSYVRQSPNTKWFSLVKVPLGLYCLSKADTVGGQKGFSRLMRKIGEAPVVFDPAQTESGRRAMVIAMNNAGYLHASADTLTTAKRHKRRVTYQLHPGPRYYISQWRQTFDDPEMEQAFRADAKASLIRPGMPLDIGRLSDERSRIIHALRDKGYYFLNNDFISFDIDTVSGSLSADVTLRFCRPAGIDSSRVYRRQHFSEVRIVEEPLLDEELLPDTTDYHGLRFVTGPHTHLNKRVYVTHVAPRRDSLYNERLVQATYSNLNALPAVSFTSLRIQPAKDDPDGLLCEITPGRNKPHGFEMEVEGTNTSGDLGAAMALSYTNRNLFHASEQLTLKLRGAYEAITGLEGYANQNYTEWSVESNLRFPTLLVPFVNFNDKRLIKGTSEARLMYDMQDRPEFHRRVLTGAWAYRWTHLSQPRLQHRADLISVNYVYMPWISDTFRKEYLEGDDPYYSVVRSSYENLFIMKSGYSFTYNSRRNAAAQPAGLYQTSGFQLKAGVELAGNVLYGLSKLLKTRKSPTTGNYELFGIAYSQYVKFDFDYAHSYILGEGNSLAWHVAFGYGIPYGNSNILPYEKRYFAGGANSVRGWSVRELGPGSYKGKDGKIDFINQTGNLKLDLSVEWRTYLFWKLHGAFFVDAGNVWNTRSYADMEGARFRWNSFFKELAVAYGLGVRLNFDYFILRLDAGFKAINPAATGRLHYPFTQPNLRRDMAVHFAVGLPF